ncbi:hypothetical protein, partial [Pseudomonas sp. IT-P218]|uniref:hypothetical protein n=1 Tax=Pseudomonas sp. IT-P218 TaxID=3026449 RepID=UPI0039DF7089
PECMTEANTHVAENRTSKQAPIVVAPHQSPQCYFRPETEELVFITDTEAGEFEQHWQEMARRINEFHLAKERYSRALENYAKRASTSALPPLEAEAHAKEITAAENRLEAEQEALHKKLGSFSQEKMSYDDVVELLPVAGTAKGKRGIRPVRYAYVKKGYFSKGQEGRKLHTVSLKGNQKKGAENSIYGKDRHGKRRIDTHKLKEQLTALEWPKLKLELSDVIKWTGLDFDPEALNQDVTLFDWAESWNKSLSGKTELGANVDVSGAAQFMRFVSNVGASAEFDPGKGNVAVKGEAKASLTIASGMVNLSAYVPDRMGWSLSYTNAKGNLFDMGMLRLHLAPELCGFVGASVTLEGQLQVVTKGDQQLLAGQPNGRLPRFKERRTRGAVFHKQMAAGDEGLQLTGEAFAGARVEGSLKGGLQWLKPTPPADANSGLLKSSGEFVDFCSINGSIAGLAGAGAGGKFHCTFINGKFCFHVAASLCWGLGAKGGLICEVGTNTIVEFGAWLVYQLYRLNYSFFDLVKEDAFNAYSQYCVMQMDEVKDNIYERFVKLQSDVVEVGDEFVRFIKNIADENKSNLESSRRRNQLATNINSNVDSLLRYTPEAKGILLYLLTRHGTWDHLDPNNYGKGLVLDIYQDRKTAVIWILRSIQTRAEWRKVFCRMTPDGSNLAESEVELLIIEQQEQKLVDFLREGLNRDLDLHKAKRELSVIYERIKPGAVWGYALAMNDTAYYQINSLDNHRYPDDCTFGPCESETKRWI